MTWEDALLERDVFPLVNSNRGGSSGGGGGGDGGDDDKKNAENIMTLEDCLNLFAVTEKLSQEDSWYCPKCKEFKEATKKMDLWTTPPLLCIHLKRFSIDSTSFWSDKLETPVSFPIDDKLDMSNHCLNPNPATSNYYLYAVSNHFGGTGGGHYTANVRSFENGNWYDCDDSSVSEVSANSFDGKIQLDKSAAYVLFYVREDHIPTSWKK
jgi:ubiquitin carboxyl-terminal hydrolase 4/11